MMFKVEVKDGRTHVTCGNLETVFLGEHKLAAHQIGSWMQEVDRLRKELEQLKRQLQEQSK